MLSLPQFPPSRATSVHQLEQREPSHHASRKTFLWSFSSQSKTMPHSTPNVLTSPNLKGNIQKIVNQYKNHAPRYTQEPQNVFQRPNDAALLALGIVSPARRKYDEAIRYNKRAERFLLIGDPGRQNACKQKAIALLQEIQEEYPLSLLLLADLLKEQQGGLAEAIACYNKFIQNDILQSSSIPYAHLQLGLIYAKGGEGIEKNEAQAIHHYKMAIEEGNHQGIRRVERKVINESVIAAEYQLALLLEKGVGGIEPDYEQAFNLLNAIANNHEDALFAIGRFYEKGQYVRKDFQKAADIYFSMANRHDDSAYRYARMCEQGVKQNGLIIVPKDTRKAKIYYKRAAWLNHPQATGALTRLCQTTASDMHLKSNKTSDCSMLS